MIEIPRGALTADEIAGVAEFFSFGTNDLTQTTLGVSRDDAGRFLPSLCGEGDLRQGPVRGHRPGRGRPAHAHGRGTGCGRTRPEIKVGICGEHGGDPSARVLPPLGMNYVSCSPFRVPIARLAAARAALLNAPVPKKPAKTKRASRRR